MKKAIALGALLALSLTNALAADCVVHIKRTACAGQEAESYKKCDGKQECDTQETAASEAECSKAALKHCDNSRTDITKYKVVTATFKGAALTGGFAVGGKADAKGANFCAADRPDLNQCK
jgi:hypothetical protein